MSSNVFVEEKEYGTIRISDEVIKTIARRVADNVEGVYSLTGSLSEGMNEKIGRKKMIKGVKAKIEDNKTIISLNIKINHGHKIPKVSYEIQERVKSSIENMTNLTVDSVDIYIQGINFNEASEL